MSERTRNYILILVVAVLSLILLIAFYSLGHYITGIIFSVFFVLAVVKIISTVWISPRAAKYTVTYYRTKIKLEQIIKLLDSDAYSPLNKERDGYSFYPNDKHAFGVFSEVHLTSVSRNKLLIKTKWREDAPQSLSLRSWNSEFPIFNSETKIEKIEHLFQIFTSEPDFWKKILEDRIVYSKLFKLGESISYLLINEDETESLITDVYETIAFIDFLALLGRLLKNPEMIKEILEIEQLECFVCNKKFDFVETSCSECGATRPTCVVCLLDLKSSEKDQIVQLPCCGVYGHKHHITLWLEQNAICPNCKENLKHWLQKLTL